jgi:hypothetical protein
MSTDAKYPLRGTMSDQEWEHRYLNDPVVHALAKTIEGLAGQLDDVKRYAQACYDSESLMSPISVLLKLGRETEEQIRRAATMPDLDPYWQRAGGVLSPRRPGAQ